MSRIIKHPSIRSQKASFAIEAAIVCLALVCLGLAFFNFNLIGEVGNCRRNPDNETDGFGLLGILSEIACKIKMILNQV